MTNSKSDIIKMTQDFWEPRLGYRPTEGQAQMMILNVTNLFKLLLEWEAQEIQEAEGEDYQGGDRHE